MPDYRRILLVRTDRIGDVVLSTPAIASFRRSWPKARIEMLASPYNAPMLRYNRDIDALHVLDGPPAATSSRSLARALGKHADLVVALAPRTDDYRLAMWTGAPKRLGYVYRRRYLSRLAASFMLTEHCISEADPYLADRYPERVVPHEVHQVLALVRLAGGEILTDELVLDVGDEARAAAARASPAGAIAVNLAPHWFESDFGESAVRALIERLAAEHRDVLVTYGSDVAEAALRVRGAVRASNVAWLGEAQPLVWSAALGRSAAVVTVDCGAVHVAAAQNVPVVAMYERRYYRLSSQEWSPWRVPSVMLCKPPGGAAVEPLIEDIAGGVRAVLATAHPVSP